MCSVPAAATKEEEKDPSPPSTNDQAKAVRVQERTPPFLLTSHNTARAGGWGAALSGPRGSMEHMASRMYVAVTLLDREQERAHSGFLPSPGLAFYRTVWN